MEEDRSEGREVGADKENNGLKGECRKKEEEVKIEIWKSGEVEEWEEGKRRREGRIKGIGRSLRQTQRSA